MGVYGLPEYALIWKHWPMESGPQICALRASGRRTSGSESTGWPTPTLDAKDWSPEAAASFARGERNTTHNLDLGGAVQMVTGWPTPMAGSPATETYNEAGNTDSSRKTTALVSGWNTLRATDGSNGGPNQSGALPNDAHLAGWATPTSRDHKDGASTLENTPINGLLGRQVSLSPALTEKRGALNPAFSLWLMGFPTVWALCAARVTRSSRKSRRSSLAPT